MTRFALIFALLASCTAAPRDCDPRLDDCRQDRGDRAPETPAKPTEPEQPGPDKPTKPDAPGQNKGDK